MELINTSLIRRNNGQASIWMIVSLLGILIAAEFGLGYFFIKNKEEIAKNGGIATDRYLTPEEQKENSIGFNLFGIPFFEPKDFSEELPVPENDYEDQSGYDYVSDNLNVRRDAFEDQGGSRTIFGDATIYSHAPGYKDKNLIISLGQSSLHLNGGYVRGAPLDFIPPGKNWTEGGISFDIKPEARPSGNQWIINLNWYDRTNPDSGYVGDIMLTKDMKIFISCWSWGQVGDGASITSNASLPMNEWTSVKIFWSKNTEWTQIYINGIRDSKVSRVCPPASSSNIYPWFGGFGGFNGWLDNVEFSSFPLNYYLD